MKRLWLILLLILFFPTFLFAEDCYERFSWLPNTESDLAGYRIYYDTAPDTYSKSADMGLPEIVDGKVIGVVSNLICNETYYFVCVAYNEATKESKYSDLVTVNAIKMTPAAPKDFKVEH